MMYKERKVRVQNAIKRKRYEQESKSFLNMIRKSKNKSKAFWQFVKGSNTNAQLPSHLKDSENNDKVLETSKEISEVLEKPFGSIGKDCTPQ